ncbi:g10550 [Coccomyxa viridis]|uniref:Protein DETOXIFICATION n=1 Tax=Coccomyxa viridis TaxID=1274662 RepID=A0ABP1GBM5_9CHLO
MASEDVSFQCILRVAAPALLLNVAAPLVVTIQTALLGHYGGSASQAAFAAVGTTANATCLLFNFLVDGISAKVGHSAGAGKLDVLRQKVRLAILCALAAGAIAFVALAALQYPVSTFFALTTEVREEASAYWWLRAALAPLTLLNMALSGILQGYKKVGISAALNTGQSILEICGSIIVLVLVKDSALKRLTSLGLVSLAAAALSAIVGGTAVLMTSPKELGKPEGLRSPLLDTGAQPTAGLMEAEHAGLAQSAAAHEAQADADPSDKDHMWDFIKDGLNMLIRSATLQATFFLALSVAGQLGTASLAAHQVVAQLWLLPSYVVDAFAVAGTVLGSRLVAAIELPHSLRKFRLLTMRLLGMGLFVGIACGLGIWAAQDRIIHLFTSDAEAIAVLKNKLWAILCLAQPINSGIFVYDGLLYATSSFAWARTVMLTGFVFTFAPVLAITEWQVHALWSIWAAKGLMNVWRFAGALLRIHFSFEREVKHRECAL